MTKDPYDYMEDLIRYVKSRIDLDDKFFERYRLISSLYRTLNGSTDALAMDDNYEDLADKVVELTNELEKEYTRLHDLAKFKVLTYLAEYILSYIVEEDEG